MVNREDKGATQPGAHPLFAETAATCPVESAINAIGGRWKLLVLRSLFLEGGQRFNRLLQTVPAISAKELARNLRELEQAGLVIHGPENGLEIYQLSGLGNSVLPLFREIGSFGERLRAYRVEQRRTGLIEQPTAVQPARE